VSEERYRQLIARVPIGILETSKAGQVRLLNPHAMAIVGLSPDADLSKIDMQDGTIFQKADRQRFWKQLEDEQTVRGFEAALTRPDGQKIHVLLNARLKSSDESGGPVCEGTMEDVTERKQAAEKLEGLHRQLVEASRQAGRADVATGVLHNVGNVLTSVNLIVHDVRDRLRGGALSYLHRVVETIHRERDRLGDFLANDAAGKAIPDFLVKLDQRLTAENETLRGDVETLVGHFEHIRQIIVVQQSSARMFGVVESVAPADLVEDALKVNFDSFGRHGVTLRKRFATVPATRVDRHKVMQILVNLMKNAKDSILAGKGLDRRITVSISARPDGRVAIAVEDTGTGIADENMVKIFQHGFTTKKDGHGFGLHSCVLAAREMSGDLTAFSDGPGRGAIFTLVLPTAA
jgi:PAS domain S-box-containing protein